AHRRSASLDMVGRGSVIADELPVPLLDEHGDREAGAHQGSDEPDDSRGQYGQHRFRSFLSVLGQSRSSASATRSRRTPLDAFTRTTVSGSRRAETIAIAVSTSAATSPIVPAPSAIGAAPSPTATT